MMETAAFQFEQQALQGLWLVRPKRFTDARGFLVEAYNRSQFHAAGLGAEIVQENQSFTPQAGAMRGLHFLSRPQAKHIRVPAGRVFNVCVDIRPASPTFGQSHCMELSAESGEQVYFDAGFAHGVLILEPGTVIAYQVDGHFDPSRQHGIRWDDPDLAIPWPLDRADIQISEKDAGLPLWREASAMLRVAR